MSLKIAIQMDPVERINPAGDSTFMLALEAQARGYHLHHYLPRDLTLEGNKLTAIARPLQASKTGAVPIALGQPETLDLSAMDVILMRQDPPFDMAYITATHLLEHASGKALVVNDPVSVRNAPEKLFATHFAGLMPETLISSDAAAIRAFRKKHDDIIVKPLFGNGGAGVFHLRPEDDNLNALLEMFHALYRGEPVMAQRYLPEIRQGDKRIILVEGEPVGAVLRVPAAGEARANLHVGGKAQKSPLTSRDRAICAAIGPKLRELGLVFVGIDVIGDCLTEINVTSPTGIQEINRLDGVKLEAKIWDAIENRLRKRR